MPGLVEVNTKSKLEHKTNKILQSRTKMTKPPFDDPEIADNLNNITEKSTGSISVANDFTVLEEISLEEGSDDNVSYPEVDVDEPDRDSVPATSSTTKKSISKRRVGMILCILGVFFIGTVAALMYLALTGNGSMVFIHEGCTSGKAVYQPHISYPMGPGWYCEDNFVVNQYTKFDKCPACGSCDYISGKYVIYNDGEWECAG